VNFFLRNLVQAAGTLFFMFYQSWELSLVAFISVPVIVVISKFYGEVGVSPARLALLGDHSQGLT
jgi:ABC-type multidrug transport system fused ATPase/permease subunit